MFILGFGLYFQEKVLLLIKTNEIKKNSSSRELSFYSNKKSFWLLKTICPLFHLYLYDAWECITAIIPLVQGVVQVRNSASWFYTRELLAVMVYGDLLVKIDKKIVEIDGESCVVTFLNVYIIAVDVCNNGLALFNLVAWGCEPVEVLACDELLTPYDLLGIRAATVLRHPTKCNGVHTVHPVPFSLDDVVAVYVLAGVYCTERVHYLCLLLGKNVAVVVVVVFAHPYHVRCVHEVYLLRFTGMASHH